MHKLYNLLPPRNETVNMTLDPVIDLTLHFRLTVLKIALLYIMH